MEYGSILTEDVETSFEKYIGLNGSGKSPNQVNPEILKSNGFKKIPETNLKTVAIMKDMGWCNDVNSEKNYNAVKVGYVIPNSPAEKSGIKVEDIILKVGTKEIETASDVISQINKVGINKQIKILLKRKNKLIRLNVTPTDITNLSNK